MTDHPSLIELRDLLEGEESTTDIRRHLEGCLACRVRYSRIAHTDQPRIPAAETVQRIVQGSEVIPGIRELAKASKGDSPEAGELWRVGRNEAMLVWVRRNFHDGAVDVIPVVLDVELADEHTLLVPASRSPLLTDLAAVVTLRSHLHHEAFIDRVGSLDIASDIEEVVAAQRTGRLSPARVGPSIHAEDDERLEYRQALRDLLAELTPSAWTPSGVDTGPPSRSEIRPRAKERDRRWFERRVAERLPSASCILLEDESFTISPGAGLEPFSKVVYLDTAVLVLTVDSLERVQTRLSDLASACISAARSSPDADAVCVTERAGDWESLLFSQASLREALVLPSGTTAGPVAVLSGLGVMDTLWKHLEGSISAWEATDQSPGGLGAVDVASIASRHVLTSIGAVESQGRRAQQDAKKTTWTRLDPQLADRVSRFVTSVTGSTTPAEALSTFEREIRDDQDS